MKWQEFCQMCLAYTLLIFSVLFFSLLKIDLNFVTTFLFTIFTISISIFFYNESTKATNMLEKLIIQIKGTVEHIENNTIKTEDLSILSTSIDQKNIRRFLQKSGKN